MDLPDPTIPVPFEKFAHLKNSDDMLHRAAFWALYAAWQADNNGRGPADIPIEARHDGHQLHAISQQLAIRDSVLITKHDLDLLEGRHHHGNAMLAIQVCCAWIVSLLLVAWLGWVLW